MGEKVDFVYLIAIMPGRHSGDRVRKVKRAAAPLFHILRLQAPIKASGRDPVSGRADKAMAKDQIALRLHKLESVLKRLTAVRTTLCSLKKKMLECTKTKDTDLRKMLWPREHLWNDSTLYTMQVRTTNTDTASPTAPLSTANMCLRC